MQEIVMKDHCIQGLEGVKRAIGIQDTFMNAAFQEDKRLSVDTEGSSILELCKVPGVLSDTVRTTNIIEIASVLGISVAVASLQAELHKTISFDSA